MKSVFKYSTIVFVLLSMLQAQAQSIVMPEKKMESAKRNILHNLDSNINGIVESTLFGIMLMKKNYPDQDYTKLSEAVQSLSANGHTAEIRVKAQLCSLYLDFTGWFSDIDFSDKSNPHKYFAQISERIQTNLLTSN